MRSSSMARGCAALIRRYFSVIHLIAACSAFTSLCASNPLAALGMVVLLVFETEQRPYLLNCGLDHLLLKDRAYTCLALYIGCTPLVRPQSSILARSNNLASKHLNGINLAVRAVTGDVGSARKSLVPATAAGLQVCSQRTWHAARVQG
jgi:hypothetical protein